MEIRQLVLEGAYEITPQQHGDARGLFLEWFADRGFRGAVGRPFELSQANCSVSAAGVIRGIHFTDVPPGQAKYVTCVAGAVVDVVVDIRVGSPTFGRSDQVLLDDVDRRSVFLAEGLGHAFMSLAPASTVVYLCSTSYDAARDHGVHPLDPDLGIDWPTTGLDGARLQPSMSDKDAQAPGLAEAMNANVLPHFDSVRTYLGSRW